jgi:hypothetical protein
VAVLLVVTSCAALRYCRSGAAIDAVLVALCVASLALLRSVFHPIWVAAVVCVVAWMRRPSASAALTLAFPVPLVLALCAKSPRSLGMGRDSRELGVRWLRIEASRPFAGSVLHEEPIARLPRGVPVLDRVAKLDGGPNLNHRRFPAVMEVYRRDALTAIRESPRTYLHAVARAALIFAAPPTEHPTFRHKRAMIGRWDRFYSRFFYGALPGTGDWPREHSHKSRWLPAADLVARVSWLSVGLAAVALPLALVRVLRDPKRPANAAIAFTLFNLVYVTLVTNLCELGENNRFRMEVEPIFWVVVVWALAGAARSALGRRAHPSRAGESPARDVTRTALQCTTTVWL